MKKILLFIFMTIVCSCKQTIEDRIRNEFVKYVKNNFDDPSILKEIVSLELNDSIDKEVINQMLQTLYQLDSLHQHLDSLKNEKWSEATNNIEKYSIENGKDYLSTYKREQIFEETITILSEEALLTNNIKNKTNEIKTSKCLLDSTYSSLNNINVDIYKIRTRIKQDESIKINDYYATIENDSIIKIYLAPPPLIESSIKAKSFMKNYLKHIEEQEELKQLIDKRDKLRKDFFKLFTSNGLIIPIDYY